MSDEEAPPPEIQEGEAPAKGLPQTTEQRDQILRYFKKKRRFPTRYTQTKEGNLEGVSKKGESEGQIALKWQVPLTAGEREAMEQERIDAIAKLDEEVQAAKQELREAMEAQAIDHQATPVLRANQKVHEAEIRRVAARSEIRAAIPMPNPEAREVLMNQPQETRKLIQEKLTEKDKKELIVFAERSFAPIRFQGKQIDAELEGPVEATEEASLVPESADSVRLKDGRRARIFFEASEDANGFLSPMWPVEFTQDSTRYFTALQAQEAERARALGKEDLRSSLLKTRSARTVRILTKKVDKNVEDPKGLWLAILTALQSQHPELQEKLELTGTDALVQADPTPGPSGIGLGSADSQVTNPAAWKGGNAMGIALESLRTQMRESAIEEVPEEEEVEESVISEAEQEKAKVGAIVNAMRRRRG